MLKGKKRIVCVWILIVLFCMSLGILSACEETYNITYELNGGTNSENNPSSYLSSEKTIYLEAPTKEGYTFLGWTENGIIEAGAQGDKNFVASWELKKYAITYALEGGQEGEPNPTEYTMEQEVTFSDPTRDGFYFKGWKDEKGVTVESIAVGSTGDKVLTAKWEAKTYFISYSLDGGTNDENNPYLYTIEQTVTLKVPTRVGYRFKGWTGTDLTEATKIVTIPQGSKGKRSYKAVWILCQEHTYNNDYPCQTRTCIYCGVVKDAEEGHTWNKATGICDVCGENCTHDYKDGVCQKCGYVHVEHTFNQAPVCQETKCLVCGYAQAPLAEHNLDGKCLCSYCQEYKHDFVSGSCSRCEIDIQYTREGNNIYFGSYPQTRVTDKSLLSTLNGMADDMKWISYRYYNDFSNEEDFMWYQDTTYKGNKYRLVYYNQYRPYWCESKGSEEKSYQDNNAYYKDNYYWFLYEPIKWRILEEKDGYATLLADVILDAQPFDFDGMYDNNYAESTIRAWLNGTFYETAFDELEQQLIQTVTLDNSARSTNPDRLATCWKNGVNLYACEDTQDRVWLLSQQEVTRSEYGFLFNPYLCDEARKKKVSDYSVSQGMLVYSSEENAGNSVWWLRSPYYMRYFAWLVGGDGGVGNSATTANAGTGVCPAIKIKL